MVFMLEGIVVTTGCRFVKMLFFNESGKLYIKTGTHQIYKKMHTEKFYFINFIFFIKSNSFDSPGRQGVPRILRKMTSNYSCVQMVKFAKIVPSRCYFDCYVDKKK